MPSNRRGARPSGSGKLPLLFIGGVCLFLAAIFSGIGGTLWVTEQRYREDGVRTQAIVMGKALRPATADTATVYEITYEYTPNGGQPRTQTERVAVHVWEAAERGGSVEVEYLAGDPASARVPPASAEEATVALIMFGVGVVLGAIALVTIVLALRAPRAGRETVGDQEAGADRIPAAAGRRQSAWRAFRRSFGFLFGGLFLVCGLPFLIIGLSLFVSDWRFAQEAQATTGLVLTKDIRTSTSGSGSRRTRTRHYEVTYRFTVDRVAYEGEDELSHAEWQRLREREPVEVFYRPGRPSSNTLTRSGDWALKIIFTLLGGIFSIVGGIVFGRALRSARLRSRLLEQGQRTEGTIVALHPRNVRLNRVRQWRLRYEYQDHMGGRHEGTFDLPEPDAGQWEVGRVGEVLYDTTQPATSVWVGRDGE